jgi:hypothetical protein
MDFSLTTVVVVPPGESPIEVGSTQDLLAGEVGFYKPDYVAATAITIVPATSKYFYIAQGRENTYLQGTKRSNKIAASEVTEWYKVVGDATATNQTTIVDNFTVQCGEDVTITLRGFSSYLETLYFNGFTRSVTTPAPCCDCDADPCVDTDITALVLSIYNNLIAQGTDAVNGDNIKLSDFYTFAIVNPGAGDATEGISIIGKPLTKYGVPCDIAAYPHEYDKLRFNVFAYTGADTTVDFLVYDACDMAADVETTVESSYPSGTAEEIRQLELNYYSYQVGYLKHLYRMAGYNQAFEGYAVDGTSYTTFYIKFNDVDKSKYKWGDYIEEDSTVILAVETGAEADLFEATLTAALGAPDESMA